jgi:hypothetical protein
LTHLASTGIGIQQSEKQHLPEGNYLMKVEYRQIPATTKLAKQQIWLVLTLVVIGLVSSLAVLWIFYHPYGVNWDEANYINRAYRDFYAFERGGLGELVRVLVREDTSRPPAFRLLTFPFLLAFGVSPQIVRLVSLFFLWISLLLVYKTAKNIAGSEAGQFSAVFLIACPIIIAGNMRYYIDFPLNLSIAGILYFLLRDWNQPCPRRWTWVGLGIFLGLGGLAKPTIIFLAGPLLLLALLLSWRKVLTNPTPVSLVKSGVLALLMMLPWWVFNYRAAISKAFRSGGNDAHALGPKGSIETLLKWLYVVAQSMLGQPLTILAVGVIAICLVQYLRKSLQLDLQTKTALWVCWAGALPLPIIAALGSNHNPRLVSSALIPLAIAMGVLFAVIQRHKIPLLKTIAATLLCFQFAVMLSPTPGSPRYQAGDAASQTLLWGNATTTMQREEQWDWSELKRITEHHQIESPKIGYLGAGADLSPTQIAFPWASTGEKVRVDPLWEGNEGTIVWNNVMETALSQDLVLTVPSFTHLLDPQLEVYQLAERKKNQHNLDLAERLQNHPGFAPPLEIEVGRFEPVTVLIFLRQHT